MRGQTMTADDFTFQRITKADGTEAIHVGPTGADTELTPLDCGMWAEHTLGIHQAEAVIRRAASRGFPLTPEDIISLGPPADGESQGFALSERAFGRAVQWVNSNAPAGYHLGMKAIDFWFMPMSWWDDTGGDDLGDGDSGLDGDWGLADLDDED